MEVGSSCSFNVVTMAVSATLKPITSDKFTKTKLFMFWQASRLEFLLIIREQKSHPKNVLFFHEAFLKFPTLKGTRCLGSDELVYKKAFETVCYEMYMVGKMF